MSLSTKSVAASRGIAPARDPYSPTRARASPGAAAFGFRLPVILAVSQDYGTADPRILAFAFEDAPVELLLPRAVDALRIPKYPG